MNPLEQILNQIQDSPTLVGVAVGLGTSLILAILMMLLSIFM